MNQNESFYEPVEPSNESGRSDWNDPDKETFVRLMTTLLKNELHKQHILQVGPDGFYDDLMSKSDKDIAEVGLENNLSQEETAEQIRHRNVLKLHRKECVDIIKGLLGCY